MIQHYALYVVIAIYKIIILVNEKLTIVVKVGNLVVSALKTAFTSKISGKFDQVCP
ncbi:hypothetical protein KCTC52924_03858 [Arenibacter antarcticus]